jgi:hypothetical protein
MELASGRGFSGAVWSAGIKRLSAETSRNYEPNPAGQIGV